jgi:hypothetical protein
VVTLTRLGVRLRLKCDGTRAEIRFRLSAKRTSPFKSARASVQLTASSRGVRISGSNAGYTKFRGSVKRCEWDWLPTPFASFPFTSPPMRHRVPSRFKRSLQTLFLEYVIKVCVTLTLIIKVASNAYGFPVKLQ